MKTVQMTLDDDLVKEVDLLAKELNTTRSALRRAALRSAIKDIRTKRLENTSGRIRTSPGAEEEFDVWHDEQAWGEDLKPGRHPMVSFKPPDKKRPASVLTRNSVIGYLSEVTVAPITSTVRDIPSEVRLDESDGMPGECAINADHGETVSKDRVGRLITALSSEKLAEIRNAVRFALDI